jgi:hypothetical protein
VDDDHPFLDDIRPITARLKPLVMRVALLYAVIDQSDTIQLPHLRAAKALCLSCIESTRPLFTTGINTRGENPLRTRVLKAIDNGHNTRTEISHALGGKGFKGPQLQEALDAAVKDGTLTTGKKRTEKGCVVDAWFQAEVDSEEQPLSPKTQDCEAHVASQSSSHTESGKSLKRGAEVVITESTEALGRDGTQRTFESGTRGYLASLTDTAAVEDRADLLRLSCDHPRHLYVIIGDSLLLVDKRAVSRVDGQQLAH